MNDDDDADEERTRAGRVVLALGLVALVFGAVAFYVLSEEKAQNDYLRAEIEVLGQEIVALQKEAALEGPLGEELDRLRSEARGGK